MEKEELQTPLKGTQGEETPKNPEIETPAPKEPAITPEPPAPPELPKTDYEKKFAESSRENQVLAQKLKEQDEKISLLTNTAMPTEDELKQAYPSWDTYSDEAKDILARQLKQGKEVSSTKKIMLDMMEETKWKEDLNRIVRNTAYEKIKGREDEFKQFAYKPTHKNVNLEVLAKAFLYDVKESASPPPSTPAPGLEKGSGGPIEPPAKDKLTPEQVAEIRLKDPTRYREMLKSGQINPEDLI